MHMISFMKGTIWEVGDRHVVVETPHIGYHVWMPAREVSSLAKGAAITLFIHYHVREDAVTLYGFLQQSERDFFELLISASGVGPKLALAILELQEQDIRQAIFAKNIPALTKIEGMGKKKAERLILEISSKLEEIKPGNLSALHITTPHTPVNEAVDALQALGYAEQEIRPYLEGVDTTKKTAEDIVNQILKQIGQRV
jgi:holliday junction DNA helicase RuvA